MTLVVPPASTAAEHQSFVELRHVLLLPNALISQMIARRRHAPALVAWPHAIRLAPMKEQEHFVRVLIMVLLTVATMRYVKRLPLMHVMELETARARLPPLVQVVAPVVIVKVQSVMMATIAQDHALNRVVVGVRVPPAFVPAWKDAHQLLAITFVNGADIVF